MGQSRPSHRVPELRGYKMKTITRLPVGTRVYPGTPYRLSSDLLSNNSGDWVFAFLRSSRQMIMLRKTEFSDVLEASKSKFVDAMHRTRYFCCPLFSKT
uniref:Uncharacterized protein n=1 Tax=Romanomermis culicivorax TaxID=13658 RepID=A0A915L3N5_ROMCU